MKDSFYTDHWKEIEPERIERYEQMFQFRAEQQPFLDALSLDDATRVLDFGCGPGFLSEAIAGQTRAEVVGADLNEEFVSRATARNEVQNLSFLHLSDQSLADQVGAVDRIICKNVLEYVPDVSAKLAEFLDALQPGGRVVIIDSDWGFVLVEPWGKARADALFEAASGAFNEMYIGRKLPGLMTGAGFDDVKVKVIAGADRIGRSKGVLLNMLSYVRRFQTLPEAELQEMQRELDQGIEDGTFMFILPQFVITARKPG